MQKQIHIELNTDIFFKLMKNVTKLSYAYQGISADEFYL